MKIHSLALYCLSVAAMLAPHLEASVNVQWYTPFASGTSSWPGGISLDSSGAGWVSRESGLFHFDQSGTVDLSRAVTSSSPVASASDGSLFIATTTALLHYDAAGTLLSSTPFTGLNTLNISAVAANASGVFTSGQSVNGSTAIGFLAKHDSAGTLLWQTTFGHGNGGITLDSAGNSYVIGGNPDNTGLNTYLAKIDPAGNLIAQFPLSGQSFTTTFRDVAIDSAGNFYATGDLLTPIGGVGHPELNKVFLRKYTSTGTLLWSRFFDRSGYDDTTDVEIDRDGNIWIGGTSAATSTAGGTPIIANPFVAEYSPSGTALGTYFFDTAGGGGITDMAASPLGGITVAGYAVGLYSVPAKGIVDPFVANVIPEPGSCALLFGAVGSFALRRKHLAGA